MAQERMPNRTDTPELPGWNLALRFGLELASLVGLGAAGWQLGTDGTRWALAIALPASAATAWGLFNVPGDPSRSGAAPVEVGGRTRLVVEGTVLTAGTAAIWIVGRPVLAIGYAGLVVLHYGAASDRTRWLLAR